MTRYYLFINREYTKIFKKNETEPIIQIEYDGTLLFNNTLKFDFYKEECVIAYQDKYFMENRYAVIGNDIFICGREYNAIGKMFIFLLDLFKLLDITKGEIVIITDEEVDTFYYVNYINANRMFEMIFKELLNFELDLSFKGCLDQNNIILGLQKFLIHENKEGVGYIDDFFVGVYLNKGKKGTMVGRALWGRKDSEKKEKIDQEFLKYLELEGFRLEEADVDNIKNYVYYEAQVNKQIDNITFNIRDEEYHLNFKNINKFVEQTITENLITLNEELSTIDDTTNKIKFYVNILNADTNQKVLDILATKNIEIASNEEYNSFLNKTMIFIDQVIKYNSILYKKKIQKLLNCKNKNEIARAILYDGQIAYGLSQYLMDKTVDEIFDLLGIKKIKL